MLARVTGRGDPVLFPNVAARCEFPSQVRNSLAIVDLTAVGAQAKEGNSMSAGDTVTSIGN